MSESQYLVFIYYTQWPLFFITLVSLYNLPENMTNWTKNIDFTKAFIFQNTKYIITLYTKHKVVKYSSYIHLSAFLYTKQMYYTNTS